MLAKEGLLGFLDKVCKPICEACLAGKGNMKSFRKVFRVTPTLGLTHHDIRVFMNVKPRHSASYFPSLMDDYSRYGYVYLLS